MKLKYRFPENKSKYFTDENGKWYKRDKFIWYDGEFKEIKAPSLLKELERQYNYWKAEQKLSNRKD